MNDVASSVTIQVLVRLLVMLSRLQQPFWDDHKLVDDVTSCKTASNDVQTLTTILEEDVTYLSKICHKFHY